MAQNLEEWVKETLPIMKKNSIGYLSNEYFFRDPPRPTFINNELFYSPADGIILYQKLVKPKQPIVEIKGVNYTLEDVMGIKNFNQECLVIGVFMTFMDVHINRIPYGGIIKFEHLEPIESYNKPMLALEKDILSKSINPNNLDYLQNNERMLNTIYSPLLDYTYYVVQIADEDVNVIAPFKKQQDVVLQNERFSLIRWGSQCELVLPLDDKFEFELLQEDTYHVEGGIDPLVRIHYI